MIESAPWKHKTQQIKTHWQGNPKRAADSGNKFNRKCSMDF